MLGNSIAVRQTLGNSSEVVYEKNLFILNFTFGDTPVFSSIVVE